MPRCTDGGWCIDDLCHMTGRTLCGIDTWEEHDDNGEFRTDDDWADDDEDYADA